MATERKIWVEIFFYEQIQNWFANKNKRKKQAIIMKGSNPRTVLGHKQNTSQKCNAVKKPDTAGHGREGLSLESGSKATGLCVGSGAELPGWLPPPQLRLPWEQKPGRGWWHTDAMLKGVGMVLPTEKNTEVSLLYKTWDYVRSMLQGTWQGPGQGRPKAPWHSEGKLLFALSTRPLVQGTVDSPGDCG